MFLINMLAFFIFNLLKEYVKKCLKLFWDNWRETQIINLLINK